MTVFCGELEDEYSQSLRRDSKMQELLKHSFLDYSESYKKRAKALVVKEVN